MYQVELDRRIFGEVTRAAETANRTSICKDVSRHRPMIENHWCSVQVTIERAELTISHGAVLSYFQGRTYRTVARRVSLGNYLPVVSLVTTANRPVASEGCARFATGSPMHFNIVYPAGSREGEWALAADRRIRVPVACRVDPASGRVA
jgi:hypothetical protein